MHDDFDRCYRAVQSKDPRFDGWFVTAVATTGIYCRPSCPVRLPLAKNVHFYPTSAAAQRAGFRACKRCRPDASPGSPEWNTRSDAVARAMRLIADGLVDREGVTGLSAHLGYTSRQLERMLQAEVGAGPLALARAQRAQTARVLIETTTLTFADVAFAAGFASIRQFNDTVRSAYAMTPTALRHNITRPESPTATTAQRLTLRLPVRTPFAYEGALGHLAATAVPGCEEVRNGAYRRSLTLPSGHGIVSLTPYPDHVECTLQLDDVRDLHTAIARCRRLLDLDADPEAIVDVLSADSALSNIVHKAPGQRIPRTVDEHELAIRAILGQQVSTAAARTHAGRLAKAYGSPIVDASGDITVCFPSVDQLIDIDPAHLAVPAARRRTLCALIEGLRENELSLDSGCDWLRARQRLLELPGVGPWTVEIIAMRALGDPDAFPVSDLGVQTATKLLGLPTDVRQLSARSEQWRPWRAYAVQYLWTTLDHSVNHWPPKEPKS